MKKFAIAIESIGKKEADKEFIRYLGENKYFYWHWITNFWIVITHDDAASPASLRDKISEIYENPRHIVIDIGDADNGWAGRGPNKTDEDSKARSMFKWLKDNLPARRKE